MELFNTGVFVCCIAMAVAQGGNQAVNSTEPTDVYGDTLSILGTAMDNMMRNYFTLWKNSITILFHESAEWNGRKYWLSKSAGKSRDIAEMTCKYFGGYLVEINEEAEYQFISSWLENYKNQPVTKILLGRSDEAVEGRFVYRYSNVQATYSKWRLYEPNGGTSQNCVELDYKTDYVNGAVVGGWWMYDVPCYEQYLKHFMCETVPAPYC